MRRLFAISDIHGCYNAFFELIVNKIRLTKSDQLILLGDYIDRGEKSKEVIDFILELENCGFNITALTGNHEVMLVDSYYETNALPLWLLNNGMSTLESFGIQDIREIEKKYLEFFASLEYYKIIGNAVFVHAGFDDFAVNPFADKKAMIWECYSSYKNPVLSGKTIIHGHRPKTITYVEKLISENSKVIPIDTGCVYAEESGYGNLSALEVNSMRLYSVPYRQQQSP
jgi:serine/threonine protein phosphatase 1